MSAVCVCSFTYLSIHLSIYLSIHLSTYRCMYLFVSVSISHFTDLLSIHMSVCLLLTRYTHGICIEPRLKLGLCQAVCLTLYPEKNYQRERKTSDAGIGAI